MIDAERMTDDEKRFWSKVNIQYAADGSLDFNKCWLWKGCRTRPRSGSAHPGYGQFRLKGDRRVRAHRHAWELYNGETMPAHLDAAHDHCDNPPCCNPAHVKPETHSENWRGFVERYGSGIGKLRSLEAEA